MKQMRRKRKSAGAFAILLSAVLLQGCESLSFGEIYPRTSSGEVEIKVIPEAKVLTAETDGVYFDHSSLLFRSLFSYIKKNEIDMTVPVEATIESARMTFYVGLKDAGKAREDMNGVKVSTRPERLVASLGAKGSYTKKNVMKAREKLTQWFQNQEEYAATGDAYAVYWNGPFTPGFMKSFEIHVPVEKIVEQGETDAIAEVAAASSGSTK